MQKEKFSMHDIVDACADKRSAIALLTTVLGVIKTITTALLIERMDVALYTPVITALGFVAMAIASPIVREKLDRYKICSIAIAILSLFLPTLIFG